MFASPAWERALGYDPKEMVGTMNVLDHVHPEDLPRLLKEGEVLALKGDKKTGRLEYRFRHADGSRLWLESVGTYLVDDPAVGGMVVNSRDVTERKQTEEALKEAESRYRTLVEQIPIVTYIDRADDSDTSVYTSPQIEKLLGYSPEEWRVDKLWAKCLHPEDEAWAATWFRVTTSPDQCRTGKWTGSSKPGPDPNHFRACRGTVRTYLAPSRTFAPFYVSGLANRPGAGAAVVR
jgi:PAS domain S-box-containing protein